MIRYSAKRLARSMLTLFIIITVVFSLLRLMPVEGYFQNYEKMNDAQIQNGLRQLGLLDPLPVQLMNFYKQVLHGDLGVSNIYRCLLYTSPSPRDMRRSRMPSSA